MRIDVLTLFPEMFDILNHSIIGRAMDKDIFQIHIHNIRDYTDNKHRKTDDYPYGGGAGMVMMVQPVYDAVIKIREFNKGPLIFLGPGGQTFNQEKARNMSSGGDFILLCGHYEGIDERIYTLIDEEISLGDFILTGGEMAAVTLIDAVLRLIPGVLGTDESSVEESFSDGTLEYPHYTRPEDFKGMKVPKVLLSGHHENIRKWRRFKSLERTRKNRPDLYKSIVFSKEDKKIMEKIETISMGEIKREEKSE